MDHMSKVRELRARTDVHYNCAQALLVGFSDCCGLSDEEAFALGSGFGAGMKCGETCGTLTAATMILGLALGDATEEMRAIRKDFEAQHVSTQCRELLSASAQAGIPRKQHCDGLVFELTERLEEILSAR
jgi:C_GCAxxG_C_C family probable redox protein